MKRSFTAITLLNLRRRLACIMFFFLLLLTCRAQDELATVMIKNLHGTSLSFSSITQKDSLVLICFWSTASDPSISEISAINAVYEQWTAKVKFRIMAVSADEGKAVSKVRPTNNMNGWTLDVYLDANGDLRRALHANNLPESLILKRGKVVYQQSGYESGSENYLFQKIQLLASGH